MEAEDGRNDGEEMRGGFWLIWVVVAIGCGIALTGAYFAEKNAKAHDVWTKACAANGGTPVATTVTHIAKPPSTRYGDWVCAKLTLIPMVP